MKHQIFIIKFILAVVSIGLLNSCGKTESLAGNTMETENAFTVRVWDSPGVASANAQIKIRPSWYIKDLTTISDTLADTLSNIVDLKTDEKGNAVVNDLAYGYYTIQIFNEEKDVVREYFHEDVGDSSSLEAIFETILEAPGKVKGQVPLPDSVKYAWVAPFGLDLITKTDSNGYFSFDRLPAGVVRLTSWSSKNQGILREELVQIRSNDEVNLGELSQPKLSGEDLTTWKHHRELKLSEHLSEWMYPLSEPTVATLRLDSMNFDFSQALENGQDIRILNPNGENLKIEKARWDSDLEIAVIHILVEDLSDSVWTLYWGRAIASEPPIENIWQSLSDSLFLELNSVLVDDFEVASNKNKLIAPMESGNWYINSSDSLNILSPSYSNFKEGIVSADSGRSGNAFRMQYSATIDDWTLAGTILSPRAISLATLDSIVFWCRGDGTYSVSLDGEIDGVYKKAWTHGSLSDQWARVSITPQEFLPAAEIVDGGNIGWEAIRDHITRINFFSNQGTEIWIDDIRLYGVNRDDLSR